MSLAVGICLAFFLEYLDNSIKTVEDLSRYTQLPALSVIPAISGRRGRALLSNGTGKRKQLIADELPGADGLKRDKLVALDSRSSAAEAYRVLRTSVLLSARGQPAQENIDHKRSARRRQDHDGGQYGDLSCATRLVGADYRLRPSQAVGAHGVRHRAFARHLDIPVAQYRYR